MVLYQKNGVEFYYKHILKKGLKNIYLKIEKSGEVLLKSSPYMKIEAEKFLDKKSYWVDKTLHKIEESNHKTNVYEDGGEIYYLGKSYPLKYEKNRIRGEKILFDDNRFVFLYGDKKDCKKAIEDFYKKEAKRIYIEKTAYFSQRLKLYPKDIKFRKAKRRLGSCSFDNVLSFNYLGVKLTQKEIDYIVVHELSHIKEKNHSKRFWDIVKKEFPDYKEIRRGITLDL